MKGPSLTSPGQPGRRLLDYGESGLLVECRDLADAQALRSGLEDRAWPEVAEVVPGARSVLLRLRAALPPDRRQDLRTLTGRARGGGGRPVVEIVVDYDGEDLADVARLTGLSAEQVVQAHTGQRWTVAFCGFAPGFAYLHGEHDRLRIPRRSSPRTRVPAGSVALADEWSGVYPREGPGGWQLIGRTDSTLWDLAADPPALLQPGAQVRFVSAESRPEGRA